MDVKQGLGILLFSIFNCKHNVMPHIKKILLHVYLLLMPLIKLTFCPTSSHESP